MLSTFSRIVSSIGVAEVDDILGRRVVLSGEKRRRGSRPGRLRMGSIDGNPSWGVCEVMMGWQRGVSCRRYWS